MEAKSTCTASATGMRNVLKSPPSAAAARTPSQLPSPLSSQGRPVQNLADVDGLIYADGAYKFKFDAIHAGAALISA